MEEKDFKVGEQQVKHEAGTTGLSTNPSQLNVLKFNKKIVRGQGTHRNLKDLLKIDVDSCSNKFESQNSLNPDKQLNMKQFSPENANLPNMQKHNSVAHGSTNQEEAALSEVSDSLFVEGDQDELPATTSTHAVTELKARKSKDVDCKQEGLKMAVLSGKNDKSVNIIPVNAPLNKNISTSNRLNQIYSMKESLQKEYGEPVSKCSPVNKIIAQNKQIV